MNLLVIISNPKRASFRQRIAIYFNILRENGINCEIAYYPSGSWARYKVLKRCADFDAVYLHKKTLNFLDAFWLRRYAKNVIYDFDDAIMYYDDQPQRKPSRRKHTKPFERTVKLSKLVIAGNSYLAEHARKFNVNVRVLPTGLDVGAYRVHTKSKDDGRVRLVWIGSKSTLRYLEQIRPALEEIGSRFENVTLRIISDEFLSLKNMPVEQCRWSKENEASDLATSDIGLAPLPDNRFTRGKCGFKVLQYAAAGLPAVASPVGVNSEYVRDGLTGYCATNMSQWVEKISELIKNAELRKQMGASGRVQVKEFDIHIIGAKLAGLIKESVEQPSNEKKINRKDNPAPSQQKKVSICIPTYNRKKYLKETIDSILAQTYKDYEIVIVDDGSTDGTEDMIKELGIPVTYHWQQNSGDAAARNKLIEYAHGQYISFVDSDDLLLPDAVEKMVGVMEEEGGDVVVYGPYFRIDENGKIYGRCKRKLRSGRITKYLFQTILVHSCGSMFPKKLLDDSAGFDTSLNVCSDYDFWLRLSMKCRFIALPAPTFKRRRHSKNLSKLSFEKCLAEFRVLERFYFEKGGNEFVPRKIAMKAFSKRAYRAGHYAIRERLYDNACQWLTQSFRQRPNLKSLVQLTRAVIAKRLASPCPQGG